MLPFQLSSQFVYAQANIFIAFPRKCASVRRTFPSLFPLSEILTGEYVQLDHPVRNIERSQGRMPRNTKFFQIHPMVADDSISYIFLRTGNAP